MKNDARALPFPVEFFDAIVSIDSYCYFGTDDLYLNYLARYLKPEGVLAIAGAGLMQEIESQLPEYLARWWTPDLWCLHSATWWRRHWERTGIVDIELADTMPNGWQHWVEWQRAIAPDNEDEIAAIEADRGEYLGYIRVIGRRNPEAKLTEPITSLPASYVKKPLLRNGHSGGR